MPNFKFKEGDIVTVSSKRASELDRRFNFVDPTLEDSIRCIISDNFNENKFLVTARSYLTKNNETYNFYGLKSYLTNVQARYTVYEYCISIFKEKPKQLNLFKEG